MNCQCFWQKQKYVLKPEELPTRAVAVEPFVNRRGKGVYRMKYHDGQAVVIGDKVRLGTDDGVVVFSIDTGEYDDLFPKTDGSI
jgi:hypothetical protein